MRIIQHSFPPENLHAKSYKKQNEGHRAYNTQVSSGLDGCKDLQHQLYSMYTYVRCQLPQPCIVHQLHQVTHSNEGLTTHICQIAPNPLQLKEISTQQGVQYFKRWSIFAFLKMICSINVMIFLEI